jgi:raffinose/stachyose/melibiose transport system substrate-binding protein
MKMKKMAISGALMALLATCALVGCSTTDETVTLTFLNGKSEVVDWIDTEIAAFETANPTIKVNQVYDSDASSALKVDINAGDIPDITSVYETSLVNSGYYYDMSSLDAWSRVSSSIKELCTDPLTNKQYRLATNRATAGLFYNKDIFTEAGISAEPTTWTSFMADLEAIVAKGYSGLYMGGSATWMLGHLMEFWGHGIIKESLGNVAANLAFINNDQTKLNFAGTDSAIRTFATRFLEMKNAGVLNSDFVTASYDDQLENFATGKAAIISQGMWALSTIETYNADMSSKIGFMPYPSMDATLAPNPVILSDVDSGYSIMNASTHKDAAVKFLNFLWSTANQAEYCKLVSSPSAFTDVDDSDWSDISDVVDTALTKGTNIGYTSTPSGFGGGEAGTLIQGLYIGDYTADSFTTAYANAWNTAYTAANA